MAELNFDFADSLYATHGLHAFAAKCPPQLVRYGITQYSKRGETVLDPMMGSGTTLVEARLLSRNAVGYDIDPLARLIASVKSKPISDGSLEASTEQILRFVRRDLAALRNATTSNAVRMRAMAPSFPRRDFWFECAVREQLALLSYHIGRARIASATRAFLWVAFSSLILSRTSVANARDIVHSRPHYWKHAATPNVIGRFEERVRRMRKQMIEYRKLCEASEGTTVIARRGDARRLRLREESADLIFTSPPYVTALDYPRAHFLAIAWMRKALGIDLERYGELATEYIGSERGKLSREFEIEEPIAQLDRACSVLDALVSVSPRQAKLAHRYFVDMHRALKVGSRVLKSGRHAILVVCPSHIRKVYIPTHQVLAEIGRSVGLRLKRSHERTISERRRVLPYLPDEFGTRMSTEYVLIFQKV